MLSPLPPPRIPPSSHTRRSQKPPGSTKTQTSPLPESLPAASPTCQELGFLGVFFFADPHKKGNRLGYRSLPGQGCRGSVPVSAVRRDVFCCGLLLLVGSPWGPIWTSAAGGEIKSKGQRGKEERLEQGWEHGADPAPTDRSPMAGHGTWAQQGWEEDSLAGSVAGAGIRRVCQQMGLAGSAVNSSARGKL